MFLDMIIDQHPYIKYTTKKGGEKPPFSLHCNLYVLAVSAEGYGLRCMG